MSEVMGKVQVILHPPLPATCVVCRKSADGVVRFLDFQASVDYYGAIVVCENCAGEMLDVLQFVPVAEKDNALNQVLVMEEAFLAVRAENANLRNALDSILVVRPDLNLDSGESSDLDDSEFDEIAWDGTTES